MPKMTSAIMASNLSKGESPLRKQRDSNMELFRCVAMFLVLGVHANFFSLLPPTTIEAQQEPLPTFTRFLLEAVCIGSVDMFVLISGWFGIHPRLSGFLKLMFQVFFCVTLVYLLLVAVGLRTFGIKPLAKATCLPTGLGWFVRAYIGLYILSPVLNAFIDNASRRQYEITLASYFCFQSLLGWVTDSADFAVGYSTASFIFLYLLARYVHIYHLDKTQRPNCNLYLAVFVTLALVQGVAAFALQYFGIQIWGRLYWYTNPCVILMSLSVLFYFLRLSFRSRLVNWAADSSLSVYLLHNCLEFSVEKFKSAVQCIYSSYSGPTCLLLLFALLVSIYVLATLFDQLRIACWNMISKPLNSFLQRLHCQ